MFNFGKEKQITLESDVLKEIITSVECKTIGN